MKKQILLSTIAASTLAATIVPAISSCSCVKYKGYTHMDVEELTKEKEITGDSDKETIKYQFKQKVTEHYETTKVTLVDLKVHNKDEQFIDSLLKTETLEDGTVNVYFNTQYFIKQYLSKYYDPNCQVNVVPSTFKFKLTNDDDKTTFTSAEYTLTINPAQYAVATSSHSSHLQMPEDSTLYVLQAYNRQYHLDDDYVISERSIRRYDGEELYGKDGVIFDQNTIFIPSDYVTGPITITASANLLTCYVHGLGVHVTYSDLPSSVQPGNSIRGRYTLDEGKEIDYDNSGVRIDGQWLTDGFTIADGNIWIDGSKVTGDVYIYIAVKDIIQYSVTAVSSHSGKVSFSGLPQKVLPNKKIEGTYTITDSNYEFDSTNTFVSINGERLTEGYSVQNGNIVVEAEKVTGDVLIYIALKEKLVSVIAQASLPDIVEFSGLPEKVLPGTKITGTYEITDPEYEFDESKSYVTVGGIKLTQGYSLADETITIEGEYVTGNVVIYIALKNVEKYWVIGSSSVEGKVTFTGLPEKVLPGTTITGSYTIDSKYEFVESGSTVYVDGAKLSSGYSLKDGKISIEGSVVTGNIVIYIEVKQILYPVSASCSIEGKVRFTDLPSKVEPQTKIEGNYQILDSDYELDLSKTYVAVSGKMISSKLFTIADGKISIDASVVTGNVLIYVALKEVTKYSVTANATEPGVVEFKDLPSKVLPGATITGSYTIDSKYEFDKSLTYVSVDGIKLTTGYSIDNGKILINGSTVTGNVVICIGVKPIAKSVLVTAVGDPYIEFAKPSKAIVGQDYKLTYKLHYAGIKDIVVKNTKATLVKGSDYKYENNILTIFGKAITEEGGDITITATGNPTAFSFTPDFDDRIYVVSTTSPINYMVDFKCTIGLYMEAGTVTGWGCAVGGDETYTQYLTYDSDTKTFTLPGKYVKGNIKIWASLA